METIVNTGMCRCCATEGLFKDMYGTYTWMGEDEVYADMLQFCFDITLSTAEDQNNGGICEVCITQLRNAANFKKQVQHTEMQFQKIQEEKAFFPKPVKLEISMEDVADSENMSDDYQSGSEYAVIVKTESTELKSKKRTTKAASSRVKKAKTDSGETSTKRDQRKKKTETMRTETEAIRSVAPKPLREFKKHQENLKSILQYSNASLIRGKDANGYNCNFCSKRYPQPNDLKSHFHKDHDLNAIKLPKCTDYLLKLDITGLKCNLCDVVFDKLHIFTDHLQKDHGQMIHNDVNNQIIPFKFDTDELKCAVCGAQFTTFKILQEHMHVHFSNYFCDICNAGFINKRRLVGHKRRHGIGTVKCGYCEKIFTCDTNRRDHEQRIHLGLKKRNKCRFCDEKFADYWTKIDHMVKVHDQPRLILNCQACERTFENKRALTRHVKKDHLMERKHVCSVCDLRFYLKHRLKDHMLVHTGEKQYQCHVCSRWYATKKSVRQHLRSHADDRRYACTVCGQTFVQQCTLKNHMRSKHGG